MLVTYTTRGQDMMCKHLDYPHHQMQFDLSFFGIIMSRNKEEYRHNTLNHPSK